jgi:hypothetical protein
MNKNKKKLEKGWKIPYENNNWAECEYFDVCEGARKGCDAKDNKENCGNWRNWYSADLNVLFKKNVDLNGNYLLDFNNYFTDTNLSRPVSFAR